MPEPLTQQEMIDKLTQAIDNQKVTNAAAAAASKAARSPIDVDIDVPVAPV